jgi:hypothetical protein
MKVFPVASFVVRSKHYHPLTEAAFEVVWNQAYLTHRRFPGDYKITRLNFCSFAAFLVMIFICITRVAQVKATILDI